MADRTGIFAGNDPFALARTWLADARSAEVNDPDAVALATVDAAGMPNVRIVLMRQIEDNGFVFSPTMTAPRAARWRHPATQPLWCTGNRGGGKSVYADGWSVKPAHFLTPITRRVRWTAGWELGLRRSQTRWKIVRC